MFWEKNHEGYIIIYIVKLIGTVKYFMSLE